MSIGILHQDLEWAEKQMQKQFLEKGVETKLYDVRTASISELAQHSAIINRVYASVANRSYFDNLKALKTLKELEERGVLCINSHTATQSDYFKDFAARKQLEAGLNTPQTKIFRSEEEARKIAEELSYPLIAKRNTGGRAVDLQKINARTELETYLKQDRSYGGDFILQEFLNSSLPYDYRVTIVGGQPLFSYTRSLLSTESDEKPWLASVTQGSKRKLCTPPKEIINVAVKGAESIGAFFDSMDIIQTNEGPAIIEHNPTPNYCALDDEVEKSQRMLEQVVDSIVSHVYTGGEIRNVTDKIRIGR